MASNDAAYGPLRDQREHDLANRMMRVSFSITQEALDRAARSIPPEHVRGVRDASGGLLGVATLSPMGQYLAGGRLDALGVVAVAVPPESRGTGAASRLMEGIVREAGSTGVSILLLYSASVPLYRRSGFEQAGHRHVAHVRTDSIGRPVRGADVRVVTDDAGWERVRATYRAWAPTQHGMLDRPESLWGRARRLMESEHGECYEVYEDGRMTGYVALSQVSEPGLRTQPGPRGQVRVVDRAWTTTHAARVIWSLIAGFGTQREHALLPVGPVDPMLALLPECRMAVHLLDNWMGRVTDVARAIGQRGYAPGVGASFTMRVRDELISANDGVWRVSVEGGHGEAARVDDGGTPDVEMPARGLAPLLTSFMSPRQLAAAGLMSGSDGALARVGAAFAGETPWMLDMF